MSSITINSALSIAQKALRPITKNYKNEALWLLQKCLKIDSTKLFLDLSKPLDIMENKKFIKFIERRCDREPLQQILKSIDFYGYNFNLRKDVFIPRPETELFVDILKKESPYQNKVLEVGTGTGCIPIVLELEQLATKILSIDINLDAIKLAKNNANLLGCININFEINNIFQMKHQSKYDLIISNPPYISLKDLSLLEPEVLLHDPLSALTDYDNGLLFYKYFSKMGKKLLNNNGKMLLEFGKIEQCKDIIELFVQEGYNYNIFNDLNSDPRFILIKL